MSTENGPGGKWFSPVGEPDKVDIIAQRHDGGVDLFVVVARPLDNSPAVVDVFARKFRNYCQYVKTPEFAQEFGGPSPDRVLIGVRSNWEVPEVLINLMNQIAGEEQPPAEIAVCYEDPPRDRETQRTPPTLPVFHPLDPAKAVGLNQQRALIRRQLMNRDGLVLTAAEDKLPLLQRLIDEQEDPKNQMTELECVGVCFGDILARKLGMTWVVVTDTWGTDVALRYKETGIVVNPRTMLSKRAKQSLPIHLESLFSGLLQAVDEMIKSGEYGAG